MGLPVAGDWSIVRLLSLAIGTMEFASRYLPRSATSAKSRATSKRETVASWTAKRGVTIRLVSSHAHSTAASHRAGEHRETPPGSANREGLNSTLANRPCD